MNRIRMNKGLGPESGSPFIRKLLCFGLAGKSPPVTLGLRIDELEMPQLMEEHVVQQESPDRQFGPMMPPDRAKFSRRTSVQKSRKADLRREGAKGNLPAASIYVAQASDSASAVVEVDGPKPGPKLGRKTA
jgi:hypothetical protein